MKNKITATLLVTLMVLSLFAAFMPTAAGAVGDNPPTVTRMKMNSVVSHGGAVFIGENVSIQFADAAATVSMKIEGSFTTTSCTDYEKYPSTFLTPSGASTVWKTKDEPTGYYLIQDTNTAGITQEDLAVFLSPPQLTVQVDDVTSGLTDADAVFRGNVIQFTGTSNYR